MPHPKKLELKSRRMKEEKEQSIFVRPHHGKTVLLLGVQCVGAVVEALMIVVCIAASF
jgi:hypothetical protein